MDTLLGNCFKLLYLNVMTSKTRQTPDMIAVPQTVSQHPAWMRLMSQIEWYDSRSSRSQTLYKTLKFSQLFIAVAIPLLSQLDPLYAKWSTSIAGALIAVLEGVQHMNQYSTLWFSYRSTAERLKHEKYLFLSKAGPYRNLSEDEALISLAEHTEEHVSTEHANWFNETTRNHPTDAQSGEKQ
ncbi:MAG: DUF4231 domain-containing protein [Alphaproteobacteria bacterium]|nr:MAG: DUF4231 domain-containing protein [Alphaproteobacteria bacterium]